MTETNSKCEWCGAPMAPGATICDTCGQAASSKGSETPAEVSADSWSMLEPLPFSDPAPEPKPESDPADRWGSPLPVEDADSPDRWGSPQTPEPQPVAPQPQSFSQPQAAIPAMPAQPEKKSRKWILFLVLGLIVICACLAIAAVAGYALFMGNGSVTF